MAEQRHGRYRLVCELGRGGMGTVYEAVDEQLNRSVALKVLHPVLGAQPGLVERFATEARIAARLDHPNIVPIYDVGSKHGVPFMAMKLVRGKSLQEKLALGAVSPLDAVAILRQVAAAMDYAHAAGVIHRDVKPGNVLISDDGQVCVADFGIASVYGATHHSSEGLVGTPEYVAPECVLGDNPTPASDIYALAVIAYEVIAGRRPFSGTPVAVLHAQAYEPPSMVGLAPPLRRVLLQGLAKDPLRRFPKASLLVDALAEAIGREGQSRVDASAPTVLNLPPPIGGTPGRGRAYMASAFAVIVIGSGVLWLGRSMGWTGQYMASSLFASPTSSSTPRPGVLASPSPAPTLAPTPSPTALPTVTPPSPITSQQVVSLPAGQTEQIRLALLQGDRVNGTFLVSGGTILGIGSDVVFRVSGPEGILLNVGRVEQQYKFQFTATLAGEYRLSFQNPSSLIGRQIALMLTYPDRR